MPFAPTAQPTSSLGLEFLTELAVEPERNPFRFSFADQSRAGHPLGGLEHLTTLLSSIGQTWELAFLTFWHEDTPDNFAQIAGAGDGLLHIELCYGGSCLAVATSGARDYPAMDIVLRDGRRVLSRFEEKHRQGPAVAIIWQFLTGGTPPDDYVLNLPAGLEAEIARGDRI